MKSIEDMAHDYAIVAFRHSLEQRYVIGGRLETIPEDAFRLAELMKAKADEYRENQTPEKTTLNQKWKVIKFEYKSTKNGI